MMAIQSTIYSTPCPFNHISHTSNHSSQNSPTQTVSAPWFLFPALPIFWVWLEKIQVLIWSKLDLLMKAAPFQTSLDAILCGTVIVVAYNNTIISLITKAPYRPGQGGVERSWRHVTPRMPRLWWRENDVTQTWIWLSVSDIPRVPISSTQFPLRRARSPTLHTLAGCNTFAGWFTSK